MYKSYYTFEEQKVPFLFYYIHINKYILNFQCAFLIFIFQR
jgi:hypothetical protein